MSGGRKLTLINESISSVKTFFKKRSQGKLWAAYSGGLMARRKVNRNPGILNLDKTCGVGNRLSPRYLRGGKKNFRTMGN